MSLNEHDARLQACLLSGPLSEVAKPLVPSDFVPKTVLNVSFDSKKVDLGNTFRARECKTAPSITFLPEDGASSGTSYLLMLIDPDAPTPDDPKFAYWRHWILPGLQATQGPDGLVAETKPALTVYLGPGPSDESKPHRYLFLLYREPKALDLKKEVVGGEEFVERRSFDAVKFVEEQGLELVGVNWMLGVGNGWKE